MAHRETGVPIHMPGVWSVYRIPLILACVSILCIVISVLLFIKSYQNISPIEFSSDARATESAAFRDQTEEYIIVDIEGAVKKPGVYRIKAGSRVEEVIEMAEGFRKDVDSAYVARTINRASVLSDGAKLYIPFVYESMTSMGISSAQGIDVVSINTASQSQLESLSGIGPVTAGNIIAGRPYQRLEELVEKQVISQNLFDKLKDLLSL